MSVKRGGGEWEEQPPEAPVKLNFEDLDLAWGVVKDGLMDAKEVLDGKVRPEDSEFASPEHAKRIIDSAEQVRSAMSELVAFPLWNVLEIIRERKKKGLDS